MNNEKLYLGSHVSMSGPDFYLGSVKEAISYGSTTFMFYTGAPQNTFRSPLDRCKIEEGRKLLLEHGFNEDKIVVHAPYIINLANIGNPSVYDIAKKALLSEVQRTHAFHAKLLVLHPGSHVGNGEQVGLNAIIDGIDEVLDKDNSDVKIALETMAGKGSELGTTFEQLAYIINNSRHKDRLGVCLDTCHVSDSGLPIENFDEILASFDKIIGLDRLLVLHINDSKNPVGAHKDRHENLGYGYIGFDALNYVVHHPKLTDIPKILETPYIEKNPPYKEEISMLMNNKFIEGWREEFLKKL